MSEHRQFVTTRDELFYALCLRVPHGYTTYQGEYGEGRTYHMAVADWLDAFWQYCSAKETAALTRAAAVQPPEEQRR